MIHGRQEILTDYKRIDRSNVLKVLQDAIPIHLANADRIQVLLDYEAGTQPLQRKKQTRTEIDTKDVDNVANEIVEFKLGYNWGNPITVVQVGDDGEEDSELSSAVSQLNKQFLAVGDTSKTQKLARFVEIGGVGYTYIDINSDYDEEDGNAYFTKDVFDPRNTFVVKSSYYTDRRVMLGVTFRTDTMGNRTYTCWTDEERYEIASSKIIVPDENGKDVEKDEYSHRDRSGERNPLGKIPIVEWVRSHDRMGVFERQIPEMDSLNIIASDMVNASTEQVDCIWHTNDVEFPEDENGNQIRPKNNDWIQTFTSKDGKTPFITALSPDYNYQGNINNYLNKRSLILQKCAVPQRNDNSGGSTGIAMSDATGWSSAEASASKQELITSECKMQELKLVLRAIKRSPFVLENSELKNLKVIDIQPNIKRQKSYELTVKVNAFAVLISHGVHPKHAIKIIGLFEDPNQVYEDSRALLEKFQDSIVNKSSDVPDRLSADNSDQIENSPSLDVNRG